MENDHFISYCPLISYVPNKNFVLKKYTLSKNKDRTPYKRLTIKTKRSFSVLDFQIRQFRGRFGDELFDLLEMDFSFDEKGDEK